MRTHHVDASKMDAAQAKGLAAIMFLRATCGTRSTATVLVDMSTNWEHVD